MPGIGSNGSSISPRLNDDMGSTKAVVDDVVQKAKDPTDPILTDARWLRKASDAMHTHKSQKPFSEDLTRAYFFVLDGEIQLAFRTRNTRQSEDYLKRLDQLIGEAKPNTADPKNSFNQFLAFATATLYYRAASHLLLLVKKAMTLDHQRLRLSMVCVSMAMSTHLRQKQDAPYLEALRSMDLLEMNALLVGMANIAGVSTEVPRMIADKETPKFLYKSLYSNATLGVQLSNSLLGSQSLSCSYPVVLDSPMSFTPNLEPLLTQAFFLDRFVWLLANDEQFLNGRLEAIDSFFPTLTLSMDNLDCTTPDALCLLDVKVFLVTCVQLSQMRLKLLSRRSVFGPEFPCPPVISEAPVHDMQRKWWLSAVLLTRPNLTTPSKCYGSLNDCRLCLHQGLETLRLVDSRGADVRLIDAAADWLLRAAQTEDQWNDRYLHYAARYFSAIVDRLEHDVPTTASQQGMFYVQLASPSNKEAGEMENRARFHWAEHEFRKGHHENALGILEKLDSVRSQQLQFEIYSTMARSTNDTTKREALMAKANELRPSAVANQSTFPKADANSSSMSLDLSLASPSNFYTPRSHMDSRSFRNSDLTAQAINDLSDRMDSSLRVNTDEVVKSLMEQNKGLMEQIKESSAESARMQREHADELRSLHERHMQELDKVRAEERQRAKEEHDRAIEQMREIMRLNVEARSSPAIPPAVHQAPFGYSPAAMHQPMMSQNQGAFWPTPPPLPYGAYQPQGMMVPQQMPPQPPMAHQQPSHQQLSLQQPSLQQPPLQQPSHQQPPLQHQMTPQQPPLQRQSTPLQPSSLQPSQQPITPQPPSLQRQTNLQQQQLTPQQPTTTSTPQHSTSGLSFASLAASSTATVPTSTRTRGESETSGGEPEHYEPETHFEPVIPLPDLVEVTTGEENEEALFSQRAKLFRYAVETNEWKERGVGELKLLRDNETKKVRLVMRRDQVHKVCANHCLTPQMKLTPMQKSDRAWAWKCQDFSEGVLTDESLAAKFKDPETAEQFRVAFQTAVAASSASPSPAERLPKTTAAASSMPSSSTTTTTTGASGFNLFGTSSTSTPSSAPSTGFQFSKAPVTTAASSSPLADLLKKVDKPPAAPVQQPNQSVPVAPLVKTEPPKMGFGDKFKPQAGSWECQGCYIRNAGDLAKCPCCGTGKDGSAAQPTLGGSLFGAQKPTAAIAPSSGGFSFGISSSASATETPTTSTAAIVTTAPTTTASASTFVFGGLTFGQTKPAVKKDESAAAVPTTTATTSASLFNQFSFGTPQTDSSQSTGGGGLSFGSLAATTTTSASQSTGGGGLSFASLAASTTTSATTSPFASQKGTTFPGTGSKLFSNFSSPAVKATESPTSTRTRGESETSGGEPEHYEPETHFEPVIPLPDLVEVTTGEENEEPLFSERAKLFRYVAESNEWKERGVGELKLLRNNDTKKVRLVMRRDQVHKVCANHSLTPQMKLTPMQKSDRAWVWSCQDFSEGVLTDETFAAKFKDPELADKFRVAFETALTGGAAVNGTQPATATPKGAAVFGNGFRLSHTSPPAPSSSAFGGDTSSSVFGGGTGSSVFGGGTSADVKPTEATSTTTAAMVTTAATAPSTSPSTFVFGGLAFGQAKPAVKKEESAAAVPTTTATTSASLFNNFSFGSVQSADSSQSTGGGGLSFASLAATTSTSAWPTQSKKGTSFPGAGSKLFSNFTSPAVKTTESPTSRTRGESETSGGEPEQYEPETHFEPVIPLPDLVEVTTGEENEEALFSQRAKLFRYSAETNEWKERGVGELKLLRDNETKKVRLVMRRDQVHKVCANHHLTPQMKLTPMSKSDRAWVWSCQDFSEGVLTDETFAAKFKDPELADKFRVAFETALTGGPAASVNGGQKTSMATPKGAAMFSNGGRLFGTSVTTESPTSVVTDSLASGSIFTPSASTFSFKQSPSSEQKAMSPANFSFSQSKLTTASTAGSAKKGDPSYQLPPNFYDYEHKEPCPGCLGCASEEDQDTALRTLDYMANDPYFDEEDEYADESEQLEPVWESPATLFISEADVSPLKAKTDGAPMPGHARIVPDGDMEYAYRVEFTTDDGEKVMSHPIVLEDSLVATEKKTSPWYADWTAYDFAHDLPVRRAFRLSFNNAKARDDFVKTFNTGVEIAKENSVHRYNPDEQDLDQQDDEHRSMFEALKKSIPKDENND